MTHRAKKNVRTVTPWKQSHTLKTCSAALMQWQPRGSPPLDACGLA